MRGWLVSCWCLRCWKQCSLKALFVHYAPTSINSIDFRLSAITAVWLCWPHVRLWMHMVLRAVLHVVLSRRHQTQSAIMAIKYFSVTVLFSFCLLCSPKISKPIYWCLLLLASVTQRRWRRSVINSTCCVYTSSLPCRLGCQLTVYCVCIRTVLNMNVCVKWAFRRYWAHSMGP